MGWIISQIGARQHYASARAFERMNVLDRFYIDSWAGNWRSLLTRMPGPFKALGARWSAEVPRQKIIAFNAATLADIAIKGLPRSKPTTESACLGFMAEGRRFSLRVNRHLLKRPLPPQSTAFYGCQSACLETLVALRDRGVFRLVDQFDPAAVEERLVGEERRKWPDWEKKPGQVPEAYYARCRAEWDAASMVMVYSPWTREAIIEQGAAREKVVVVPLAYEAPEVSPAPARPRGEPLVVLWLGKVLLRKGIPYLLEAARLLKDRPIKFLVAGEVAISEQAVASAPANVQFIGRVVRGQSEAVYRSADLFVLPTISDSFAITQVEAMAHGLPVIATDRCGQVVTPGVDGEIIPTADSGALAAAIAHLDDDRELLAAMSASALTKSRQFTLRAYYEQLRAHVIERRPELAAAL